MIKRERVWNLFSISAMKISHISNEFSRNENRRGHVFNRITHQKKGTKLVTCVDNVIVLVLAIEFNFITSTPIHCLWNCVIILLRGVCFNWSFNGTLKVWTHSMTVHTIISLIFETIKFKNHFQSLKLINVSTLFLVMSQTNKVVPHRHHNERSKSK